LQIQAQDHEKTEMILTFGTSLKQICRQCVLQCTITA